MMWENYKEEFVKVALESGHNDEYIEKHLKYAKSLFIKGLPIIFNQDHLSLLVGYKLEYLIKVSNAQSKFYRVFNIPKKNGGKRKIAEPLPNLKAIQKWILEEILNNCKTSDFAKAYKKGISLKENAKYHRRQKKVLTIDIENFFGNIEYIDVYWFFMNLGYTKAVSTILANICTLNDSLPQGASTSPALSNLIFIDIDKKISKYCMKNKIRYTRYADDLTFSGDFETGKLIKYIRNTLSEKGFTINESKTRVRFQYQRQEVTGITVNNKMQVARNMRKKLRQNIYYIKKFGIDSHMSFNELDTNKENYIKHLIGVASFIYFINSNDREVESYLSELKELWRDFKTGK